MRASAALARWVGPGPSIPRRLLPRGMRSQASSGQGTEHSSRCTDLLPRRSRMRQGARAGWRVRKGLPQPAVPPPLPRTHLRWSCVGWIGGWPASCSRFHWCVDRICGDITAHQQDSCGNDLADYVSAVTAETDGVLRTGVCAGFVGVTGFGAFPERVEDVSRDLGARIDLVGDIGAPDVPYLSPAPPRGLA